MSPLDELPVRHEPLAKAKPFLMPRGGPNDTHRILPPEKENRKICFKEEILVTEIENRFYLNDFPEDDEEGSYEIEIVDDDGDADFYLEIVDGEVFYVFETEDDISLESEGSLDADGNPQRHQHDEKSDNLHHSHAAMDDEKDINEQLNSSMFINYEGMMLAPDLDESDTNNLENADLPMEISFDPEQEPETMDSFNQGSQFMDLDNFMESSSEEEGEEEKCEEEKNPQEYESLGRQSDDKIQDESGNMRNKNLRVTSEETLLLMEDDAELESPEGLPKETIAEQEEVHEKPADPVYQKPVSPTTPAKPQSESTKNTDMRPVAPSRKTSLTLDEKKVTADLEDDPTVGDSQILSTRKSFEKVTISTVQKPAEPKEVWTKPISTASAAISTESTTARMVRERSDTVASPEPSSPSKHSNDDDQMYSSPVQNSPTKTKSILKCNPASPVKTPIKDRSKHKKSTTKTFSKTYVRADQLDGEHRVYTWAKPDWTNKRQELRPTGRAEALRNGKLEAPITFFPKKPVNNGLDSDADMGELVKKAMKAGSQATSIFGPKKNLRVSVNGAKLREGKDIVKPITKATVLRQPENINKVANPSVLKPTPTGQEVRKGATLAAPVTFPTLKYDDTNQIANPNVLRKGVSPGPKKQYEWSKPDWTKKAHLRNTPVGEAVKKGADLQGPITDAPHVRRRKSFDSISVGSSDSGRSDEAIAPSVPRRGKRIVPSRTSSLPSSNRSTDSGEISATSRRSSGSQEAPELNSYETERLRKEKEQKERQERLARMARAWQKEEHSKNPYY